MVDWYNDAERPGKFIPIELAAIFHYRYIRIHPFEDGIRAHTASMVRIWNTAPQMGHLLRISYFACAIFVIFNQGVLRFAEYHRPKCRMNDLVQIYDNNSKTGAKSQSSTKSKSRITI